MGETTITDEGVKHLSKLSRLEKLWLHDTKVTDEGLMHLTSLKQPRQLMVYNTSVSAEGYQRLQEKLPNCLIVYKIA